MRFLFLTALFLTISAPAFAACDVGEVAGTWNWSAAKETYTYCNGTNTISITNTDLGTACASADGTLEYDYAAHIYKFCFGGGYYRLGIIFASGGACPVEAQMEYDTGINKLKYCKPTGWLIL